MKYFICTFLLLTYTNLQAQDMILWDSLKVSTTLKFDGLDITLEHPKDWTFEKKENNTYYAYFDDNRAFMFVSAKKGNVEVSKEALQEISVSDDFKDKEAVNYEGGYKEVGGYPTLERIMIKTNYKPVNPFYGYSLYSVFAGKYGVNLGWQTTETSKPEVAQLFENTFPLFKLSVNSVSITQ